tara:strand:- start:1370 stop:1621 length:252 start_codon:yes stop_codon:yes gene_type:complete
MAKKMSKKEKVLMYLQTYGSITPQDAYELFQSMRLGALIHDLRHNEPYYNITSKLEGKAGYARYTLEDGVYEDYSNSDNNESK